MRSLPARLLALFLAVLPVAWGTCPCWIGSGECGSSAKDGGATKRCSCCAAKQAEAERGRSTRNAGRGDDDQRRNCCDGCPIVEIRHGATPAPVTVAVPEATLLGWALPLLEVLPAVAASFAPRAPSGFTGPPPIVNTVVLRI